MAEPSEDELDVVEAVAIRSISLLGLPGGVLMKRSGEAFRSFLSISRSASFIFAVICRRIFEIRPTHKEVRD
jgi:hypothetical protein